MCSDEDFMEHLMNVETIPNPNVDVKRERYWMQTYIHYCPLCGKSKKFAARVHEPSVPAIEVPMYDWCDL